MDPKLDPKLDPELDPDLNEPITEPRIDSTGDWLLVPVRALLDPPAGKPSATALIDHHWLVDEQGCARFWLRGMAFAPQANRDRRVAEIIMAGGSGKWAQRIEHLDRAFLPVEPTSSQRRAAWLHRQQD